MQSSGLRDLKGDSFFKKMYGLFNNFTEISPQEVL